MAHTPYRPQPEVELLSTVPVTIEDAIRGLEDAALGVCAARTGLERLYNIPGSSLVNFRQVPRIVESLQQDWRNVPVKGRPDACFVEVHGRLEIHMHPCFMGERLMEGMRGAVGTLLLRYSSTLNCVPLGFKSLLPAGTHAALVFESPYVHFLIDFRAIGFVPKEGHRLVGKVGEVQTAIGINFTILNCFNLLVHKSALPSGVWFDAKESAWMTETGKLGGDGLPLCVQISKPIAEDSGPDPLNFRGILCWSELNGRAGTSLRKEADDPRLYSGELPQATAKPEGKKKRTSTVDVSLPKRDGKAAKHVVASGPLEDGDAAHGQKPRRKLTTGIGASRDGAAPPAAPLEAKAAKKTKSAGITKVAGTGASSAGTLTTEVPAAALTAQSTAGTGTAGKAAGSSGGAKSRSAPEPRDADEAATSLGPSSATAPHRVPKPERAKRKVEVAPGPGDGVEVDYVLASGDTVAGKALSAGKEKRRRSGIAGAGGVDAVALAAGEAYEESVSICGTAVELAARKPKKKSDQNAREVKAEP